MFQSGTLNPSVPAFQSCQRLMTFSNILDTVLHLSDEEWTTLTEAMTHEYTKLKFVSLCTEIVTYVSESVIWKMLPDLIDCFGIESVLRAEAKLKEKDECESMSRSATPSCSGQRLPEDSSDLECNSVETGITQMTAAMQALKTVADKINTSLKNISADSHVKPETDGSVQLQNKATRAVSETLVEHFSHILSQTSLDPNVVTSSETKEIIEIMVNGLVRAAEEKNDHACRSGSLISTKMPCSCLQDAAQAVFDHQEEPLKLLADVDSCTEEVMWQLEKLYLHEEKLTKSSFYQKPRHKRKMYIDSNAETTSGDSSFFASRSDVLLDEAAMTIRDILMQKAVPELVDKPITTLYDSGPFRSQFSLKRAAMDSGSSVVMILNEFYESLQSMAGDAKYSSDALPGFVGDAVDIGKQEPLKSARTTLTTLRSHLQDFLSKFSPEEIDWEEDEQVIDLCTEEVINQAVHLYRNELTDQSSFTDIDILTSAPFQTKLSQCVSGVILQKLESCPSLMPTKGFSEGHLKDISSEISRSVSSTLQKFARAQLALRSGSSSHTPLSFFSPLFLFIKVKKKLKQSFSMFKESPEKPSYSAESEKDDRVVPIPITDDGSDLVRNSIEIAITKIKGAMQEAIRRVASGQTSKTMANEINISPESDVKPETDDSMKLQNKATRDVSDTLVNVFPHISSQTSLDPNVVTSSETKEIIEIMVNGLVSAAEEKDDHACRRGSLISTKMPCSGLQDAPPAVLDHQEEPSKLLADVDSCTEVNCSAESGKDDHLVPIHSTDDGHVHEITDENELLFKREKEKSHILTNVTAECLLKSNRAGICDRICSSDSLLETAGTAVNTVNSIPCHAEVYTLAEESTNFLHNYVLTPSPKHPHLPWSNDCPSCSTPEVISDSGAEHEAEKNILDRPAGRPSPSFKGSPEKPDFSAESKKDDDRGVRIDITGDDSAPERTDENELLLKQKKDTVSEKANVLTDVKPKAFSKSNRAGSCGTISPSDSLLETAGTEVNTAYFIPRYPNNNTFSESKRCLPKYVLKTHPQCPLLPWSQHGSSCSTPQVISGSGVEHEAEKNILDRPAEKDTVCQQADSLRESAGTISHDSSADWFDIILENNTPINCGFKKENNGGADILTFNEQPTSSTEEELHKTSRDESQASRRFGNFRKRLTRIFSRIS